MKPQRRQSDQALVSAAALLAHQKAKQTHAGAASPQAAWTRGMLSTASVCGASGTLKHHGLADAADNIIDSLLDRLASTGRTSPFTAAHAHTRANQPAQQNQIASHACWTPQLCRRAHSRSSSRNSNSSKETLHAGQLQHAPECSDVEQLQLQASNNDTPSPTLKGATPPAGFDLLAPQLQLGFSSHSGKAVYAPCTTSASPVRLHNSTAAHGRTACSRSTSIGSDRPSSSRNSPVLKHISFSNNRSGAARTASRSSSRSSNSSSGESAASTTAEGLLALQQLVDPSLGTSLPCGARGSWHTAAMPGLPGNPAVLPSSITTWAKQSAPVAATGPAVSEALGTSEATRVSSCSSSYHSRVPSSGMTARSATCSTRLAAPAKAAGKAARPLFSTEALEDPAVWLPQQHLAVQTALSRDLAAVLSTGSQLQQQKEQPAADSTHAAAQEPASLLGQCSSNQAKQQQPLQLLPPQFPGTAPTLRFTAKSMQGFDLLIEQPQAGPSSSSRLAKEDSIQVKVGTPQDIRVRQQQLQEDSVLQLQHVRLLVKYYGVANNAVKQVFKASGFKRTKGDSWNVLWGSLAPTEMLTGLNPLQKHNHFPGTWELGRKDRLYKTIAAAARRTKGKAFTFVPKFFVLPSDAEDFKLDLAQNRSITYIRKPAASSRGRGVRVVKDPKALDLSTLTDVILQHYVPDPLLIGGRKFDLRVYVAVTCLDPLRLYVYREGLVRFASEKYSSSKSSRGHATMHLTNYSINKTAKGFQQPGTQPSQSPKKSQQKQPEAAPSMTRQQGDATSDVLSDDVDCDGDAKEPSDDSAASKWSFGQLAQYLQSQGHDFKLIWEQVCRICTETLIAAEPSLSSITRSTGGPTLMSNCFEVFGFDVMLDSKLKAWLLEVNTCPALNADSPLDVAIKTNMVADIMGLVGITPCSRETYQQQQVAERQARLIGLATSTTAAESPKPVAGRNPQIKQQQNMQIPMVASAARTPMIACGSSPKPKQQQLGEAAAVARTPPRNIQSKSKAQAAAAAAAAAVKTIKEVEQLDLLAVPPEELPECIKETEAEWRRSCKQQQRWQQLFPVSSPSFMQELLCLFETPRIGNAMVLRYYQQLSNK